MIRHDISRVRPWSGHSLASAAGGVKGVSTVDERPDVQIRFRAHDSRYLRPRHTAARKFVAVLTIALVFAAAVLAFSGCSSSTSPPGKVARQPPACPRPPAVLITAIQRSLVLDKNSPPARHTSLIKAAIKRDTDRPHVWFIAAKFRGLLPAPWTGTFETASLTDAGALLPADSLTGQFSSLGDDFPGGHGIVSPDEPGAADAQDCVL